MVKQYNNEENLAYVDAYFALAVPAALARALDLGQAAPQGLSSFQPLPFSP